MAWGAARSSRTVSRKGSDEAAGVKVQRPLLLQWQAQLLMAAQKASWAAAESEGRSETLEASEVLARA